MLSSSIFLDFFNAESIQASIASTSTWLFTGSNSSPLASEKSYSGGSQKSSVKLLNVSTVTMGSPVIGSSGTPGKQSSSNIGSSPSGKKFES